MLLPLALLFEAAPEKLLSLHPVDLVIIALYFVMVLGIGFYLKRYTKTGEDFFLAGRDMTAWVAGLSFVAANLGSLELMGWAGSAYQYGILATHWYWIGAFSAMLFLGLVMDALLLHLEDAFRSGLSEVAFRGAGARRIGDFLGLMTVLMSGINMYSMALVLKIILGWDISFSIWVSSLTVAAYVFLGGLLSAIFNEVLQFFLIWLGALVISVLGLIEAGGWSGMVRRIHANFPDRIIRIFGEGWAISQPIRWVFIGPVLCWASASSFPSATGPPIFWLSSACSRRATCAARKCAVIGSAFKMAVPFIVILPGIAGSCRAARKTGRRIGSRQRGAYHNEVLPLMLARYCGPGLLGLGITALLPASCRAWPAT